MPTYEYNCTECGKSLEAVQKFSDAPLTVCPHCGGRLRKVYSAVGVVFKGSGFYRTDSRDSSRSSVRAANGSGKKASEGAGEASSSVAKSGSGDSGSGGASASPSTTATSASPSTSTAPAGSTGASAS